MENKVFYLPKFQNSGKLPKSTNKWLKTIGETILDFTPIVGDVKELSFSPLIILPTTIKSNENE